MTDYLHIDELDLPALPPAPRRRCIDCNNWLARTNHADRCAPCAEIHQAETARRLMLERTDR